MEIITTGISKRYQRLFDVTEERRKAPIVRIMILRSVIFLIGLFKPINAKTNHIPSVSKVILPLGCKYINTSIGKTRRKDMRKRNHSLYFSLREKIADVVIITVNFAISEGCICIGPIINHLFTFLIGGPKSSVATRSANVKM